MDFTAFIQSYFINPLWDRTGYNIVNTLAYAAVALGALYLIWRQFEKHKVQIDRSFWACALAFVLFGSSLRVLTDSIDAGVMQKTLAEITNATNAKTQNFASNFFASIASFAYPIILRSHLLDYGWLTVTPGIYIVVALLFLTAWALGRVMGRPYWAAYAGGAGAALCLLLLLPMAKHWDYALIPVVLSLGAGGLLYYWAKWRRMDTLPVMGQALDGAATWVAIDLFGPATGAGYFEQHVLSNAIGQATPLGFGLFVLLKAGFATVAVWALRREEMDERTRNLALLVIAIIGFAPGLRDLLRMLCGT